MKLFFIEPSETLMFGQPQSFAAGEAHRSQSLFPPSPFTFQGLIRTHLLHHARPPIDFEARGVQKEIASLVGPPDQLPKDWQLTGPYPARKRKQKEENVWIEPWVPAPRFLLCNEVGKIFSAQPMSRAHNSLNDLENHQILLGRPETGECKPMTGWVAPGALKQALTLTDHDSPLDWRNKQWTDEPLPPFVRHEFQPGLAIEPGSATASHGLLYFLEAIRFEADSGLLGDFSASLPSRLDDSALEEGAALFGRKGRLVSFHGVDRLDSDWEDVMTGRHLPEEVTEMDCFWLVTLTPVRLENSLQLTPRESFAGGVYMETLAALTGPPLTLGGFSIAEINARPNRLYLPAGSAWAVCIRGGNSETRAGALRVLNNRNPFGPTYEAAMGFGHIVVGRAPTFNGGE